MINPTKRTRSYPFLMHRWFKRGEGWAFHPSLDSRVERISLSLEAQFKERERASFASSTFKVRFEQGYLVGIHRLDTECEDTLAARRCPTILAAAVAAADLSSDDERLIQAEFERRTFPQKSGPLSDFKVEIVERDFDESAIREVLLRHEARFAVAVRAGDLASASDECLESWHCVGDVGVLELGRFLRLDPALREEHLIDAGKSTRLFETVPEKGILTLVGHGPASDGGGEVVHLYSSSDGEFQSGLKLALSIACRKGPSKG